MRLRLLPWILGERGGRFVVGVLVACFWLAPVAAIVFDSPGRRSSTVESYYRTAWVTVLLLLAITVLFTLVLEEALGHRRAISALRWVPSTVACALTSILAISCPRDDDPSSAYRLGVETFAAIVILGWTVHRWRRDRTAPLAEAIAVRSVHGRRSPARRD